MKVGFYPEWIDNEKDSEFYDTLIKNRNYRTVREGHKNSELMRFNWNVIENKDEVVDIFFDYRDKSFEIVKVQY